MFGCGLCRIWGPGGSPAVRGSPSELEMSESQGFRVGRRHCRVCFTRQGALGLGACMEVIELLATRHPMALATIRPFSVLGGSIFNRSCYTSPGFFQLQLFTDHSFHRVCLASHLHNDLFPIGYCSSYLQCHKHFHFKL